MLSCIYGAAMHLLFAFAKLMYNCFNFYFSFQINLTKTSLVSAD